MLQRTLQIITTLECLLLLGVWQWDLLPVQPQAGLCNHAIGVIAHTVTATEGNVVADRHVHGAGDLLVERGDPLELDAGVHTQAQLSELAALRPMLHKDRLQLTCQCTFDLDQGPFIKGEPQWATEQPQPGPTAVHNELPLPGEVIDTAGRLAGRQVPDVARLGVEAGLLQSGLLPDGEGQYGAIAALQPDFRGSLKPLRIPLRLPGDLLVVGKKPLDELRLVKLRVCRHPYSSGGRAAHPVSVGVGAPGADQGGSGFHQLARHGRGQLVVFLRLKGDRPVVYAKVVTGSREGCTEPLLPGGVNEEQAVAPIQCKIASEKVVRRFLYRFHALGLLFNILVPMFNLTKLQLR